jgi:hypothetical protein
VYLTTDFDPKLTSIKVLYDFKHWDEYFTYSGMVNKDNEPHGFGRMIKTDKSIFYEG